MNTNFFRQLYLISVVLLCCLSCSRDPEDHSMPIEAYKQLGMPDPERKWTLVDYTQAYNVLAKIKWEKPLALPMKDSKHSGLLFQHMTSLDYLSFLRDTTVSLNEKAERISEFTRVYDYWMDIYTVPILKENRYGREIVEIQIFNMRLMEAMVDLANKINVSQDADDATLQYGYESIKQNYLTALRHDLMTQHNTLIFQEADLNRMADSVFASVTRNTDWMDSTAMNQLIQSLRAVADGTSSDYIRNRYNTLEKLLTDSQQEDPTF